jgi:serine/threonine-protein kinase
MNDSREQGQALLAHADTMELAAGQAPVAADPRDPVGWLGQVVDGRYRIDAFVAEGGAGYVYRGENVRWGRRVAVKCFKRQGPGGGLDALLAGFLKEGAILNDLSRRTTAIVQSYDAGKWVDASGQEVIFNVLEWLDGETLAARMTARGAAWSLSETVSVLTPVADALQVAHTHGIAHRDVKPGNIFLAREGGVESAKLLDFGIAKVAAETPGGFQSTARALEAFTVGYAAPEQLTRTLGPTGPWTDVYALAMVAVEMLAGRHPHEKLDTLAAMRRTADRTVRPTPLSLGVMVPRTVEAAFAKALAVDPKARHPSAYAFWAMLTAPPEAVSRRRAWGLLPPKISSR